MQCWHTSCSACIHVAYAAAQPLAYAPRFGMQHSALVGYTATLPLRSCLANATAFVLTRMSLAVAVWLPPGPEQQQQQQQEEEARHLATHAEARLFGDQPAQATGCIIARELQEGATTVASPAAATVLYCHQHWYFNAVQRSTAVRYTHRTACRRPGTHQVSWCMSQWLLLVSWRTKRPGA
jgi:hypothetical protein